MIINSVKIKSKKYWQKMAYLGSFFDFTQKQRNPCKREISQLK